MGNAASTLQIYDSQISDEMKQKIISSAAGSYSAQMSEPKMAKFVSAATNDTGTDYNAIEAYADDMIDAIMKAIAYAAFTWQFGTITLGGIVYRPPGHIGDGKIIMNLCSISTPVVTVGGEIPSFISGILGNLDLPTWVERQASWDLVPIITPVIKDSVEPQWSTVQLSQVYDSAVGDQGDWRFDIVILCVTGALTFDGLRAGFAIMFYVAGVCRVNSDSKSIRDGIRRDAFSAAAQMAGGSTPSTDGQLSDTLTRSGTTQFRNKFNYNYGDVPPESLRAENISAAYLKSNTQLLYLPMINPGNNYLLSSIEQGLYSGLDVPILSVKQEAVTDMTNNVSKILGASSSQTSWRTDSLDRVFTPADPTLNPMRQQSILFSWYQYKYNSNQLKIPVSYVFLQTTFYEELPTERKAIKRLFQILADKIRQELQKPPGDDDVLSLKAMLNEYTGNKFRSSFGFSFNGDNSNPPDRREGGLVRGYSEFMQSNTYPTSVTEVEGWLDAEVFLRNSLTFPEFANNRIWEKIRDDIVGFTKTSTSDDWYSASNSTVYRHPSGGTNIKQYSQYVYTVGELELEGVRVKRVYVYYLGVYCGTLKTS